MYISLKAAIVGAPDYAGDEAARLLATHLEIEVTTPTTVSNVGRLFDELHPQISFLAEFEVRETSIGTLPGHNLVILALPHGHSAALIEGLDASGDGALVLGYAVDHRLTKVEDWMEYYGGEFSPT